MNVVFTSVVPDQISLMWSQMALAADMALDNFLALMTAAPLCCTVCGKRTWTLTPKCRDAERDWGRAAKYLGLVVLCC